MSPLERENVSPLRVIFNSGLYGITTMLQAAVGFFLLPLYTSYLSPRDYGITGLVASFTAVVSLFITLSLESAVSRFYFEYRETPTKLREFWGTIVLFVTANGLIVGLAIFLLRDVITSTLISGVAFNPYLAIGTLTIIVSPAYTIYQSILRTTQQAARSSALASLSFLLTVGLTVGLVVGGRLGATGVLVAHLVTALAFGGLSAWKLIRDRLILLRFRPRLIAGALSYSLPLIPHLMSMMIAQFVAKLLLNNVSSTADLGLFNVGSQFLILITAVQGAVNTAYVPWFFSQMKKGKRGHRLVIKMADHLSRANLVGAAFLGLFSLEIVGIMTARDYSEAWRVIPALAVAYQFRGIYLFYVNTLFYNKIATRYVFVVSVSSSIVGILLNVALVKQLGIMAPAIAILGQQVTAVAIVGPLSRAVERVDFQWARMLAYCALLAAVLGAGLSCDYSSSDLRLCPVSTLPYRLAIFLALASVLAFLHRADIRTIMVKVIQRVRLPKIGEIDT